MNDQYFEFLKTRIGSIDYDRLKHKIGTRRVYVWGADHKGRWLAEQLKSKGVYAAGFLDSRVEQIEGADLPVRKVEEIIYEGSSKEYFVIVSMLLKHEQEIMNILRSAGFSEQDYFYPCRTWNFITKDIGTPDINWLETNYTKGEKLAQALEKEKFYFLLWGGHIGDEALALSWIGAFKQKNLLKEITVITSALYAGLARLYADDINDIIVWEKEELDALRLFSISDRRQIYNIIGAYWRWIPKECEVPFPIAQTVFKTVHMGLNYQTKSKYIDGYGFSNEEVQKIVKENQIIQGKSVILIPYAKSTSMLPVSFWEELAERLSDNYRVFTNVAKSGEEAIKNTIPLNVSLEYIVDIVKYAGNAVSIRCGLTDVLALGKCNCQVLYAIDSEYERNYAQVNSLYVNGKESILYKNAVFIDVQKGMTAVIQKIMKRLKEKSLDRERSLP